MPLISVIIPSYNHAQFIEQAIRSVLTQDYRPLEIVIIDDGSTDNSRDFINELLATKPEVPIKFIAQENSGAHAAINRGIREAQGDVIAILNSDDFYYPQRFTTLLNHVPIEGEFLVFSELDLIDEASNRLPSENEYVKYYEAALANAAHSPAMGFALLRANCAMTSGNFVFSRSLFDRLGGFNNQKICHDIDFLLRATYFLEPTFVRHKLMAYRIHHGNTTKSTQHLLFEEGMRAVNNFLDMCANRVPDNDLAPVRANWPLYFNIFSTRYPVFFSNQPLATVLATADSGCPTRDAVAFNAALVNELRQQEETIRELRDMHQAYERSIAVLHLMKLSSDLDPYGFRVIEEYKNNFGELPYGVAERDAHTGLTQFDNLFAQNNRESAGQNKPLALFVWDGLSDIGGVEVFLSQMLSNLGSFNIEPFILDVGTGSGAFDKSLEPFKDRIINIAPLIEAPLIESRTHEYFLEKLLRLVDIVVINDWLFPEIIFYIPDNVARIAICHVDSIDSNYYLMAKNMSAELNGMVGVSGEITDKLKQISNNTNISHIPYGVEYAQVNRNLVMGNLRLIYLGRLIQHQKRIFDLCDFVACLNELRINCTLTIAGEGEDASELILQLSGLHGTATISFLGRLTHEQAMNELAQNDILVLFSDHEGLPIVLLEALMRGVVPIVSKIQSGISEILEHDINSLMFPVGAPRIAADLVAAISADHNKLSQLKSNAEHLGRQFTVDKMCSDYAALIRDAVCRNKNQGLSQLKDSPPYFLLSADDDWVERSLWIKTYEMGNILFHIDLPDWMPLELPWTLVANQENNEIASLVVHSPGTYTFKLSVSADAKIKLAANQWFVPRDFGVSPDDRHLSFRIIDHIWEASC